MSYSAMAGCLVTLSLLFLFVETRANSSTCGFCSVFVGAYGLGVLCWLILGVLMDRPSLVAISALQILFLALYWSEGPKRNARSG